jgi:orotate phosphoribosyltransferase
MPYSLPDLLKQSGALLDGHFRLSSGLHSPSYVQCARLLENPADASLVGADLAGRLQQYHADRIVAPALGGVVIGYVVAATLGIPFQFTERKDGTMTLRRGFRIPSGDRVAIVEDVVTTGKSTRETAEVVAAAAGRVVAFGSILDRTGGRSPFEQPWEALLKMSLETFTAERCPLCAAGVPLDAPGSRHSGGK